MKNLVYCNLILIFLLQFINQVFIPIPLFIIGILYVFSFFFSNKENILGVYLYLIMISSGFLLYLTNILFVIFLLWYYRNNIIIGINSLLILLLTLNESVHVFINSLMGFQESIIKLFGFLVCFIPFMFLKQLRNTVNIKVTFNFLLLGFISFSLITIGTYITSYNVANFFNEIRRFGYLPKSKDESDLLMNPNTIGKNSAFIVGTYLVLINLGYLKYTIKNIILISYVIFIGSLTLSRSFFLLMITALVLIAIYQMIKKKVLKITMLFLFLISSVLLMLRYATNFTKAMSKRILETDDISGGRLDIYSQYINIITTDYKVLLFGTGMQDYLLKVQNYNSFINQSSHNIVLEILTIWGIVGLIIVIMFMFNYIFECKNLLTSTIGTKILLLIPIIIIILSAMFGQFFISYYHTFALTFFALILLDIKGVYKC